MNFERLPHRPDGKKGKGNMKFEVWIWEENKTRQYIDLTYQEAVSKAEAAMMKGFKVEIIPR